MASSIVPSYTEQANIFSGLVDQMMQQGQLIGIPQVPGQVDMETGTTLPAAPAKKAEVPGGNSVSKEAAAPVKQMKTTDQSVTAAVANQGQLIPIASPTATSSESDDLGDIKRLLGSMSGGNQQNPAAGAQPKDSGGGGGGSDILGTIVDVGLSFIGWIICTELVRQGKMPRKWWVKGARVFANYPSFVKQGYYLWAVPCVHHLRARPDSVFSAFLCAIFNARAHSIAERTTIAGTAVTVILWPICWALGAAMWLCNIQLDGLSVYREAK